MGYATKIEAFKDALSILQNEGTVERLEMLMAEGGALRRQTREAGMAFDGLMADISAEKRAAKAAEIIKLWQGIAFNEQRKKVPVLAVMGVLEHMKVYFLEPDGKEISCREVSRTVFGDDESRVFSSWLIWEALAVTMKRRAAEGDLKAWHQEPTFQVLGLGLYDGELVFVYSYVSPEHGLVLYRLPVQEEDLPDLPTEATD